MTRRSTFVAGSVLALLFGLMAEAPAGAAPGARDIVPRNAIIVLEIGRPAALLDLLFNPRLVAQIGAHPAYQKLATRQEFVRFLQVVKLLELGLGADWRTVLAKLTGGGMTLAINPDGSSLLVVDAADGAMLAKFNGTIIDLVRVDAAQKHQPERVSSRDRGGVTVWSFGDEEAHAIVGSRLLVANRPSALEAALDAGGPAAGRDQSLAANPDFLAAAKAVDPSAAGLLYVNLEFLKLNPDVRKGLEGSQNPFGALLFAGITDALRASRWLAMGVLLERDRLGLVAAVDGSTPEQSALTAFTWPAPDGSGALPNLSVPRRIAAISFYRDLARFYSAKDALFPERSSAIIFFENMMGIFFTGRDFSQEVLAQLRPEVRLVVAEQAYDPAIGTPRVQLPSFAAVFRLKDPERFGIVVEEAWQKALGLVNFTRGQDAQPGLMIDRPEHGGIKFTIAGFSNPTADEKSDVPMRYNFRPALARVGEHLIMSSTEGLARDLIDALKLEAKAPPKPGAWLHSILELDGGQLHSILRANRENLVTGNMIEEGRTREEAEAAIDLLLLAMSYLDRSRLHLGTDGGKPRGDLEVKLDLSRTRQVSSDAR